MLEPVYMLAIDHRWQWEEWCDTNGVARTRIPEIKSLAAEAFLAARQSSGIIRRSGALLVDLTYGRAAFDTAQAAGAVTGTPAERAGAFPLEWTAPFDEALRGDFVKVLVRHRSDVSREVVESQQQQLLSLQHWCVERKKPFILEVLVAPATGEEAGFDSNGRPQLLASYIRDAYAIGMKPDYWKIEGMPNREALTIVDAAIRTVQGARQLILGKGAGMEQVRGWFESAAGAATAAGFAIGRTVYFDAASAWALDRISRDEAIAGIKGNYEAVISAWEQFHGAAL
jgi:5-dehydro-2-deoxygluconokinase